MIYVNSFTLSQKDMLASVLRITDSQEAEWTILKEPARDRYDSGVQEIKEGKPSGYGKMMFTRVFFSDSCGDFEHGRGTVNAILGLPKEDLDEATKTAIDRSRVSE